MVVSHLEPAPQRTWTGSLLQRTENIILCNFANNRSYLCYLKWPGILSLLQLCRLQQQSYNCLYWTSNAIYPLLRLKLCHKNNRKRLLLLCQDCHNLSCTRVRPIWSITFLPINVIFRICMELQIFDYFLLYLLFTDFFIQLEKWKSWRQLMDRWGPRDDCGLLPAIELQQLSRGQKRATTSYSSLELLTQGCAPQSQSISIQETKKEKLLQKRRGAAIVRKKHHIDWGSLIFGGVHW